MFWWPRRLAIELDNKSTTPSGDGSVLLKRIIPESVIVRIPKIEICGHFVNSWSVVCFVIYSIGSSCQGSKIMIWVVTSR
mmetsp:Transcript_1712/g.3100  ORF Transcript_1712/g.3100 Transcript_1712/m.3100 type:complete len:80 (+) Transcript_1712:32-271(+)